MSDMKGKKIQRGNKKNTKLKQSSQNPEKMEKAGEHSTDRTRQPESTSGPSRRRSESNVSSGSSKSSATSDVANMLVPMTLDRAANNLGELGQRIFRWESEGHSNTADSEVQWACRTQQKAAQHSQQFFYLRRVFAEHQGDLDTTVAQTDRPEDLLRTEHADEAVYQQCRQRFGKKIFKGFTSAWKRFVNRHPRTKVPDEQGLDVDNVSESSFSTCDSPFPDERSHTASISSFQAAEHCDVMSPVMEEDLVAGMDSIPAPYRQDGHLEPSEVHVGAEQNVDENVDTASCNLTSHSAPTRKLSATLSISSIEDTVTGKEAVTDIDATPEPSMVLSGAERVNEVIGSPSSDSNFKKSLKADKKSRPRKGKKTFMGFNSAWKHFVHCHPRIKVTGEQALGVDDVSESNYLKCDSTFYDKRSHTASISSFQAVENCDATSPVMEEDLVTGMDLIPAPSRQDGHLEPSEVHVGAEQHVDENVDTASINLTSDSAPTRKLSTTVSISSSEDTMTGKEAVTHIDATPEPSMVLSGAEHVDEVIGSPSSDSNFKKSPKAERKSRPRKGKKIFKGFDSAWKLFVNCHPKIKVTDEQALDVDDASESSYSTCDSTFHDKRSHTASISSFQAAEHCDATSPVMEEDLVTGMDSIPAPSRQDGHLEPSEVHVGAEQNMDENVETGSNNLKFGCASYRELNDTFSIRSSEDIWTAEKAEHVTGMAKGTTVIMVLPAPGHACEVIGSSSPNAYLPKPGSPFPTSTKMEAPSQKEDTAAEPSTTSSPPPPEHQGQSPVEVKDQMVYTASTSRHSAQDRHLEDSLENNSALNNTVKGFIDGLTEQQRKEWNRCVYSLDVQKKLSDSFVKGMKVLLTGLTAELSSPFQYCSLHTWNKTSCQVCLKEALTQELISKFSKELNITDEHMRQMLNGSFVEASCDVAAAKTPVSISPKIIRDTQITERKLFLPETSDQRQRPHETKTTGDKVHEKRSSWWSLFCKCWKKKVHSSDGPRC